MRALTLPPHAGWRWILAGFAIFRRNPPMMSMLVISYWLLMIFLNVLPVIGALLASMAMPGLSVGLMQAARNLERGEAVSIQTLFSAFRDNARTLVLLGALYLFCTLGILGVSALFDGGDLLSYMMASHRAERPALEDSAVLLPSLVVIALLVPVMMAWWFAPVLAAWHHLPLGKSLFFSFVACWLNWRPFLVYGGGLLLVAGVLPGLLLAILLILLPGAASFLTALLTVPMALIIAPAIFASFYACYRDIFGISEIV
jgi:hypothetical protein